MRWEQYGNAEQTLAIQVVDPMSVFAYSWSINGAPPRAEGAQRRLPESPRQHPVLPRRVWPGTAARTRRSHRPQLPPSVPAAPACDR